MKDLHWMTASTELTCTESDCSSKIYIGDQYAIYTERLAKDILSRQRKYVRRNLCEDCGKLTEDSLETTDGHEERFDDIVKLIENS